MTFTIDHEGDSYLYDYSYPVQEFAHRVAKLVNDAQETYLKQLFLRAYIAGFNQCEEGVWFADCVADFDPATFEKWFEDLKRELHAQVTD